MKKLIIIPSREASTRLPGKPLAKFGGKTLVRHVWEKASAVPNADVCVATDSEKIRDEVFQFGGRVEMTDPNIPTGTKRGRYLHKRNASNRPKRFGTENQDGDRR